MSEPAFDPAAATSLARSSELLGFGSGARLLIVNSDDFGMYPAVNTAVVESIELGIASSCSLMVPCPAAQQAMRLLGRKPGIDFGIHLTLTCDSDRNRWGPVAARELVPSLLDETGELFTPDQAPQLLGRARLDEVELEFRAQIYAVAGTGLQPTHLDWHCLADGGRGDIFDLTVALATEYGLAVRAWRPHIARQARPHGSGEWQCILAHRQNGRYRRTMSAALTAYGRHLMHSPGVSAVQEE